LARFRLFDRIGGRAANGRRGRRSRVFEKVPLSEVLADLLDCKGFEAEVAPGHSPTAGNEAMKGSKGSALLFAALLHAASALAGGIDMDDPRRVVGREDDIRVDAQLVQDTVSPGSAIGVTWQIQNFTASAVAVADKLSAATYDSDSRTITFAIGAEVPQDGRMPHVTTIAPGEKKVFRTGATPALNAAELQAARGGSHYVQVKVTVLRDLAPFSSLIAQQTDARDQHMLSDELFEKWFESNDTILLNSVPVRFSPRGRGNFVSADRKDASGGW
jgi:hypothetical protein